MMYRSELILMRELLDDACMNREVFILLSGLVRARSEFSSRRCVAYE
jgi:hypothetical protein